MKSGGCVRGELGRGARLDRSMTPALKHRPHEPDTLNAGLLENDAKNASAAGGEASDLEESVLARVLHMAQG